MVQERGRTMKQPLPADFQCLRCGNVGTYRERIIDYPITVNNNTILVNVQIEECTICHEQLFDDEASTALSAMAEKLRQGDTSDLVPVGTTYRSQIS
jgi:YgiT-type zinc finger domain-containing protein